MTLAPYLAEPEEAVKPLLEAECTCHYDCCECDEGPDSKFMDHAPDCHGCSQSGHWHAHEDDPCRLHSKP